MRRRGRILVLLGLVLAVLAFILANFLLQGAAAPPTPQVQTTQVVVALQEIPERTEIPVEAVGTREIPVDAVPPNALRDPSEVQGKWTIVRIFPGQIIVSEMVVSREEAIQTGFASFAIPEGFVAIAFPISDVNSVAGAIQPGDFVDILITIRYQVLEETPPEGVLQVIGESLVTQLTLQDVEVLKVGLWNPPPPPEEGGAAPPPSANFLTVLLAQQDALVLKHLRDNPAFTVDFALRGVGDHALVTTESVTLDYLFTRFDIVQSTALPRIVTP